MGLLALVAGILAVSTDMWWLSAALIASGAILIIVLTIRAKKRRGVGIFCLICLLLSLTAMWRTFAVQADLHPKTKGCRLEGRIAACDVDERGRVSDFTIDDVTIDGASLEGKVIVYLNHQTSSPMGYVYADASLADYVVGVPLSIGQTVTVEGTLYPLVEDYYDSRSMHRVVRKTYHSFSAAAVVVHDAPLRLTAAERVRTAVYRTLRRNMSSRSTGFAYAFLMGDASFAADEVLSGFRSTGTAHLLAVSGLHVGILAALLLWIFKKCKLPPWAGTTLLAAVLGVYAWLCAATPSVLRASIVAVTLSLTGTLGVYRDRPSTLSLAALILLVVNPLWLFDVSFLLSYAAFAGIYLLYPPLRSLLKKVPGGWGDALSLNLAVTAATLPLTVYFYGGFSALAVPINFVLIPVMSLFYPLLLVLTLLSFVPAMGLLLTLFDYALMAVIDAVVAVGSVGYLSCALSVWQLPLYYGAVALVSPYCLLKPAVRYSAAGAFVLTVVLWTVAVKVI